ncbi:MAG: hypothetical protein VCA55_05775, partial [Verrucomicrobiales bacterium]
MKSISTSTPVRALLAISVVIFACLSPPASAQVAVGKDREAPDGEGILEMRVHAGEVARVQSSCCGARIPNLGWEPALPPDNSELHVLAESAREQDRIFIDPGTGDLIFETTPADAGTTVINVFATDPRSGRLLATAVLFVEVVPLEISE